MPKQTQRGGNLQFTFKVDADYVDPDNLDNMKAVFMELDLNPNSRIYEDMDDPIFEKEKIVAAFKFMLNYIEHLDCDRARKTQLKKNGHTERIAKIILNKNSPATSNLYYLSSYNGDLKPPRG